MSLFESLSGTTSTDSPVGNVAEQIAPAVLLSPVRKIDPPLANAISVGLCTVGAEFMVDAEDGHAPYRMKLIEVKAGIFKFADAAGAKVDLEVGDFVWLPSPTAPVAPVVQVVPVVPVAAAAVVPVASVVVDSTKVVRGGNCPGSGVTVLFVNQPSVVNRKVVCDVCGTDRPIPKEVREMKPTPTGMPFPGHRRPKGDDAVLAVSPSASVPTVPPTPPPLVSVAPLSSVPSLPVVPAPVSPTQLPGDDGLAAVQHDPPQAPDRKQKLLDLYSSRNDFENVVKLLSLTCTVIDTDAGFGRIMVEKAMEIATQATVRLKG